MLDRLVEYLNRPVDDDFFAYPTEHYAALSEANRYYYRMVAIKRPQLVRALATIAPDDTTGATYTLPGDHLGKLRIFTPPGPTTGNELFPASEGVRRDGFYTIGRVLYLTVPRVYDPGLYILWTPASLADLDEDSDPTMPSYLDECIVWRAAGLLAKKPGSLIEPQGFLGQADEYWRGNMNDPSDSGALGTIIQQELHGGVAALDGSQGAWWRGIS
jgi:hypothetical protein